MRIGLTCYPTYGGSGAVAAELAMALGRRGHEVHVISYSSPFRLRGYVENVSFHEVDLSGTYPLLEYFLIHHTCGSGEFVLHGNQVCNREV